MNAMTTLFQTLSRNMTSGMYYEAQAELGITGKTLKDYGIGYHFLYHAWAFPERTPDGEIVGITYRSHSGKKWMHPGCDRGLAFMPTQFERTHAKAHRSGRQTFIPCTKEIPCPICGRIKYCMVSSDNPHDPSAVACTKVSKGSVESFDWGNLHILKDEGDLRRSRATRIAEGGCVIIVEGARDTQTAIDLGFAAIGKPGAVNGLKDVVRMVTGYDVVIIGENDGTVGVDGMKSTFQSVKDVALSAVMVLPPATYKDLHEWVEATELTADDFMTYVDEHGEHTLPSDTFDEINPQEMARRWLAEYHTVNRFQSLYKLQGTFVSWNGVSYTRVDEDCIAGSMYRFLESKKIIKAGKGGTATCIPLIPDKSMVIKVMDALKAFCPLVDIAPPVWVRNTDDKPEPHNLIQFTNGILNVPEYIEGNIVLYDPTPELLSLTCVPHPFDEDMDDSSLWTHVIEDILEGDEEKIRLLAQWFGYNMIPDMSQEKLMVFVGPPRSGKGTIIRGLCALLGQAQVASTSFSSLSGSFGFAPLMDKLSAVIGDAKMTRHTDMAHVLESILNITGRDPISINRKGRDHLSNVQLTCRFTLALNLIPEMHDYSGAFETRLNLLQFTKSYLGREDLTLKSRISETAREIVPWALAGLRDLRLSGTFIEPETSTTLLKEVRHVLNPTAAFISENCEVGEKTWIAKRKLYDAWVNWAAMHSHSRGTMTEFVQRLRSACPDITVSQREERGREFQTIEGVNLTEEAHNELLD